MSVPSPTRALCLHPENPHYFLFRGQPTVSIGAGEHYAAVLNLDFNYRRYLDTLHAEGLNHTRLFVGVYRELVDEYWPMNPLGPQPGRFVCPVGRSSVPGARDGGNKFDLDTWDPVFFQRLTDFCQLADERDIIVEVNLFCPYYIRNGTRLHRWLLSPWYHENNINGLPAIPPTEIFTLKHPELLRRQEAMVEKIVREVNPFDNIYFEICNEPYCDNISLEWQYHIAELITRIERDMPLQHLISQNVANGWAKIENPHPAISIFNFHYPRPEPTCVTVNYGLNKAIGCNETGFDGLEDAPYRIQAWQFMLAGGALFSHLDPSFRVGDEAGSVRHAGATRFGGGPALRKQLRILKDFMESFDFLRMAPANGAIVDRGSADAAYLLAEEGKQYALYLRSQCPEQCTSVTLRVPNGKYVLEWISPCEGPSAAEEIIEATEGRLELHLPQFQCDIAARIVWAGY